MIINDHSSHTSEPSQMKSDVTGMLTTPHRKKRKDDQVNNLHYSVVKHSHIFGLDFSLLIEKGLESGFAELHSCIPSG